MTKAKKYNRKQVGSMAVAGDGDMLKAISLDETQSEDVRFLASVVGAIVWQRTVTSERRAVALHGYRHKELGNRAICSFLARKHGMEVDDVFSTISRLAQDSDCQLQYFPHRAKSGKYYKLIQLADVEYDSAVEVEPADAPF